MNLKNIMSVAYEAVFSNGCIVCEKPVDIHKIPINNIYRLCDECRKRWSEEVYSICGICGEPAYRCRCGSYPETLRQYASEIITVARYDKNTDSVAKSLILTAKENDTFGIAETIAGEMAGIFRNRCKQLGVSDCGNMAVTYVPRLKSSVKKHGFDHMKLVAKAFSKYTGIRLCRLLVHENGGVQKGLDSNERKENAENAFSLRPGSDVKDMISGKTVIILDDVITTGSTLGRCAELISSAGADCVICLAFAKTVFGDGNNSYA